MLCVMVTFLRRVVVARIMQHLRSYLVNYMLVLKLMSGAVALSSMGFDKNQLIESQQNRLQNEATVANYLLLDDRLRTTSGYLGSDFQESMDSSFSQVIAETPTSATELQQHVFTEGTFGCLALPCFAWLGIKIHRLVSLLPVSVLALSRIFVAKANPSDLKPLSAAGKPGLAERGEVSWPRKPTKHAQNLQGPA